MYLDSICMSGNPVFVLIVIVVEFFFLRRLSLKSYIMLLPVHHTSHLDLHILSPSLKSQFQVSSEFLQG